MDVDPVYKHGEQRACGTAVDSRVFVVRIDKLLACSREYSATKTKSQRTVIRDELPLMQPKGARECAEERVH
jgi:hypothetical protein